MKLTGNRCLCSGCGEYFNSVSAFDMHRSGPADARVCRQPGEAGMVRNEAGYWITCAMPTKPAFLARTRRQESTISENTYPGQVQADRP